MLDKFRSGGAEADCPSAFGVAEEDINCRCYLLYSFVLRSEFLAQGGVIPEFVLQEESELQLTSDEDRGIMKMGKSAYQRNSPDFSKYEIREDKEAVEAIQKEIIADFGLSESDVKLDGIINTDVLQPFISQLKKIQQETSFKLPNIYAVDVIDGDPCCIAGYKPMENRFYISSRYFNSKDALLDTLKEWVSNGVLPKYGKTIRYLAEHEAAHMRIPDKIIETEEAISIFSKCNRSKVLGDYDEDLYEFYADCVAIQRVNPNIEDSVILEAIKYLQKEENNDRKI